MLFGMTDHVQERRKEWLKFPRTTRAAIRRLHQMVGHKPKSVVEQILKGKGAPQEQIQPLKFFSCEKCDDIMPKIRRHPVAAPGKYSFNYEVIMGCFEAKDWLGERFAFFSVVSSARHSMPLD